MAVMGAVMLLVLLAFNAVCTRRLWRSGCYDNVQKTLQGLLIWLLPGLGGALVWAFLREP